MTNECSRAALVQLKTMAGRGKGSEYASEEEHKADHKRKKGRDDPKR